MNHSLNVESISILSDVNSWRVCIQLSLVVVVKFFVTSKNLSESTYYKTSNLNLLLFTIRTEQNIYFLKIVFSLLKA